MLATTSMQTDRNQSGRALGYAILRLAIGMSMLIHGLVRLPKISAFASATVKLFAGSPLPSFAVDAFARITPPVELVIGIMVLFGVASRIGLTSGGLWMVLLIFGSALIEKYDAVGIQLIYSLIFFHLLQHMEQNTLSIDGLIARHSKGASASPPDRENTGNANEC
jgi:thiosulfate dehydrogenase [quinone] large subunit